MLLGAWLCSASPCAAEEVLLAEEGAAILPVESERRLEIEGIAGQLWIRAGKPGELRFRSTHPGRPREELPLALWQEGDRFRLAPLAGGEATPHRLEVALPPEFRVRLRLAGSDVTVSGLGGDLEISGTRLAVTVRNMAGPVSLDLTGGTLELSVVEGDLEFVGSGVEATIASIAGEVDLTQTGGRTELAAVQGALDAQIDDAVLHVRQALGAVRVRGSGGELVLAGLAAQGRLELEGTPVRLEGCRATIDIETDAAVEFRDNLADIHVNGYGASLRGVGNSGLLEIKTHGAEINVERIGGAVRVEGDDLRVALKEVTGEIIVYGTSSDVRVEGAKGPVAVENEFGDVTVNNADAKLAVKSRDGEVRLTGLKGAVSVEADGGAVLVAWRSMTGQEGSTITSLRGDVTVHFPAQGGCLVEASAGYGRIESELSTVRVSEDGARASGMVNRRSRPTVRVESAGSIVLAGPYSAAE